MFARALIVLLLVLNVGVAAWWALRPAPRPVAILQPRGVARLQLLSESPRRLPLRSAAVADAPDPAIARDAAVEPETAAVGGDGKPQAAVAPRCFSFGPFESAETVAAARDRLQPQVLRSVVRARTPDARGWRVLLPPLADAQAAGAMARRIADAGFSDYLVLHDGDDANAIALGRYGNQATARRRVDALKAAGFPARAEPLDDGGASRWLDVAAAAGFDAARAQSLVAAPSRKTLDCGSLQ